MTDYADVPTITTLHQESQNIQNALNLLNAGGTMSNFTVAPPPPPTDGSGIPSSTMYMSVNISVPGPISPDMTQALIDTLTTRQAEVVSELADLGVGPPPPPITDPPVNTTAPVVTQVDTNLNSTTGVWDNTPTSYTYSWLREDGIMVGTLSTYPIAFADVDLSFTCTVTATNNIGTTQGPPSNSVVVVSPP